ncbi:MAG: histidine kinase [Bacteroidota bacterium]
MFSSFLRSYWPRLPLLYTALSLVWGGLWIGSTQTDMSFVLAVDLVLPEVAYWNGWAMLTPIIVWLAHRSVNAFRRPSWKWALHLPLGLLVGATAYALGSGLYAVSYALVEAVGMPLGETLGARIAERSEILVSFWIPFGFLVYVLLIGVGLTQGYLHRLRDEEQRSAALRAQLAEARLDVLARQLQPHFLFNALNTISATLHEDPAAADRMLSRLGDFLRRTLDQVDRPVVPLREDLAFCEQYLGIVQDRFETRLTVDFDVDPVVEDAAVPYLLLQPLVENAVQHGVARHAGPATIEVRGRRDGAAVVVVEVYNSAPPGGLADASKRREVGLGLANTRARLEATFAGSAQGAPSVVLASAEGGVVAQLRFPYRSVKDTAVTADLIVADG